MINRHINIAVVAYTWGIDYDDRIRKEILSISKLCPNISFKIFAVEPSNREENGTSSYGVPYRIPYLKSRDRYPSGSHTFLKAWDFYKTVRKDLKQFDAVWCADPETFIFVLMLRGKPLAWDLHELPLSFMHNPLWKLLFRLAESKVDVMIHANEPRLKHLESLGMINHPQKQFFLRNYPDANEINSEYDTTYFEFKEWLGNSRCVYLQGIDSSARADVESIGAVLAFPNLKGVVVCKIQDDRMRLLENTFGKDVLHSRFFFTGLVKQLKTPQYIKLCDFGLVFYKHTSANNWFCEPNRLFQSIINGNPVVVGNNPPMKDFVEGGGYGVVAQTDGNNQEAIEDAIKQLMDNYEQYKHNVSNPGYGLWSSQEPKIKQIIEKFLSI